jgi:hypothetical protein
VALITDYGFGDDNALRYSVAIVSAAAGAAAIGFVVANLKYYDRSVREMEAAES